MADKLLHALYYDPKTGFASLGQLYNRAKEVDPSISRPTVRQWLEKQVTYSLHKQARRHYPRNKVIVRGIDDQWQGDLVDLCSLHKYNSGYRFLLNVIDIFSKYLWSIPLKNKKAETVAKALNEIFQSGRVPMKLQTDKGSEFVNKDVQKLLKSFNIQFFTTHSEAKSSVVERVNRTLKERMWRYFTHNNTWCYTDILPKLVDSYNSSYHRTIKMAPNQVSQNNEKEIYERVYKMKKTEKPIKFKFSIGDKVRISKLKGRFEKGYMPNWSEEVYIIIDRFARQPPVYAIKDQMDEPIEGKFYDYELQRVHEVNDFYIVEKIIKTRKKGNKKEYYVKWRGYPEKFNSWVTDIKKL